MTELDFHRTCPFLLDGAMAVGHKCRRSCPPSKTKQSKTKPKQAKPNKRNETTLKQKISVVRAADSVPHHVRFFCLLRGPSVMAHPLRSTSYCTTTAPFTSEQYYYSTTSLHRGRRRLLQQPTTTTTTTKLLTNADCECRWHNYEWRHKY
jgi:hypothetical protein